MQICLRLPKEIMTISYINFTISYVSDVYFYFIQFKDIPSYFIVGCLLKSIFIFFKNVLMNFPHVLLNILIQFCTYINKRLRKLQQQKTNQPVNYCFYHTLHFVDFVTSKAQIKFLVNTKFCTILLNSKKKCLHRFNTFIVHL